MLEYIFLVMLPGGTENRINQWPLIKCGGLRFFLNRIIYKICYYYYIDFSRGVLNS